MVGKNSKGELGLFPIIGLIALAVALYFFSLITSYWQYALIFFIILLVVHWSKRNKIRKNLMIKYADNIIVKDIMEKRIWVGETSEQLLESLGRPYEIDVTVLKTKNKETWKYYYKNSSRFGLRVFVENNKVIGWKTTK